MPSKVAVSATAGVFAIIAAAVVVQTGILASPLDADDYETTTVTLQDRSGTNRSTVDVRIADTDRKRYVGLSETASLAEDEGMLFVHNREERHAYVMRNMSFPLDIVFIDANGTITRIHHAETEPNTANRDLTRYPGTGKYVLEVERGYTNRTCIEEGDTVVIPDSVD